MKVRRKKHQHIKVFCFLLSLLLAITALEMPGLVQVYAEEHKEEQFEEPEETRSEALDYEKGDTEEWVSEVDVEQTIDIQENSEEYSGNIGLSGTEEAHEGIGYSTVPLPIISELTGVADGTTIVISISCDLGSIWEFAKFHSGELQISKTGSNDDFHHVIDLKPAIDTGKVVISYTIGNLDPDTTYYFRAWINNNDGEATNTVYSDTIAVTTERIANEILDLNVIYEKGQEVYVEGKYIGQNVDSYWLGIYDVTNSQGYAMAANHITAEEESNQNNVYAFKSDTFKEIATDATGNYAELWVLKPNTKYRIMLSIYSSNSSGEVYKDATFTTYADINSWDLASGLDRQGEICVFGQYYAGEPINGAKIMYSESPDLSDCKVQTLDKNETNGYSDTGFNYTLTGLKPDTTYYVQTTVLNEAGTTTSEIKSLKTDPLYQVSIEYVNASGEKLETQPDNAILEMQEGDIYQLICSEISQYIPKEYRVQQGENIEYMKLDETNEVVILSDTQITVYYYSSLINIEFPAEIYFQTSTNTNGVVVSDRYHVTNQSELPVEVTLKRLGVDSDKTDGISFVRSATGPYEMHLNLERPMGLEQNGFVKDILNIEPNSDMTSILGKLGGSYYEQELESQGVFTVGGEYSGVFPAEARYPEVSFVFHYKIAE